MLTATDSELAESVVYHPSLEQDSEPMRGVFLEEIRAIKLEDVKGDRVEANATLELQRVQNGRQISVVESNQAYFMVRNSRWLIRSVATLPATLVVQLYQERDKSIRKPQTSAR